MEELVVAWVWQEGVFRAFLWKEKTHFQIYVSALHITPYNLVMSPMGQPELKINPTAKEI
jgi:hypothetical protein